MPISFYAIRFLKNFNINLISLCFSRILETGGVLRVVGDILEPLNRRQVLDPIFYRDTVEYETYQKYWVILESFNAETS